MNGQWEGIPTIVHERDVLRRRCALLEEQLADGVEVLRQARAALVGAQASHRLLDAAIARIDQLLEGRP